MWLLYLGRVEMRLSGWLLVVSCSKWGAREGSTRAAAAPELTRQLVPGEQGAAVSVGSLSELCCCRGLRAVILYNRALRSNGLWVGGVAGRILKLIFPIGTLAS